MGRREFEIAFVGLKPGVHEYDYEINDKFFEAYQQQDFSNCRAKVKVLLDKHPSFMVLKFEVGGSIEVVCDRCGNNLPLQLWDEFNIVVKLTDQPDSMNNDEEDPDVYYIARTESHLHLQDWIYEFINLSIPMQKMCSESEMGGPHCNLKALEMLKNMNIENNPSDTGIWKGLDKLKGLEN
ncbi:MAG: DUF177 domain-containing protein [Dinghuibacter sp.]|nr:DUF177 domain-containing protein [Dinghuibacter sp.]